MHKQATRSHLISECILLKGVLILSRKRDKGYSQAGKPNADNVKQKISAEELERAIHPTNRQSRSEGFGRPNL
jgi:hypothetical protein